MPTSTARLRALADLVLPDRPMADIGTDHGRLPAGLVAQGRVPFAVGVDLREAPLVAARATARALGLQDDPRLSLRIGDGLSPLLPGEVATVVIAGMGGLRILDLLAAAPAVVARLERLVLQPNTDLPAVRAGLGPLGLGLVDEGLLIERGQAFTFLVAAPGPALAMDEAQLLLGPFLQARREAPFLDWLHAEELRLTRAIEAAGEAPRARLLARERDLVRRALHGLA
ncbi:class I SAM-dependent methyltransferase [Myxococcota bacterium]|nr:class I SAM-dependent methyltransferase [Myxococcota bacterium]